MLALAFALLMAVIPPGVSDAQIQTIEAALDEECFSIQGSVFADWCAYQFTDLTVSGRTATTRVQFSLGCDGATIEKLQEAEFIVTVDLRRALVSQATWIPSAHLPNGVQQFTFAFCSADLL